MKVVLTLLTIFALLITVKAQEIPDELYMDAFIVVSDTSEDYLGLREKMFQLSENLGFEIDTMGRGFNTNKNLICLPDNDEDEIYAGEYFPRRYPSEALSLEHLNYYSKGQKPSSRTIALVVMITDEKEKAELKVKQINKYSESAFIINTKLYMGCMH